MKKENMKKVDRVTTVPIFPVIRRVGGGRVVPMTSRGKKSDKPHKEFNVRFKDNVISAILINTWHKINTGKGKSESNYRSKGWLIFGPGKNNICYLNDDEFNQFFSIVE